MGTITTTDGVEIFYKDWGSGQPIVFSHGWPLSADDWDTQMLFFLQHGYRVIAHDRRGHGRSSQTGEGHDMDHYADDLAAVTAHLDLHDAVHIGHSTGGGEVVHYIARHGESRVAKALLISSVTPLMVQTEANPGGLPKSVFDGIQEQVATNRACFYRDSASGPFYGFNRPGVEPVEAIIENWWRQGMMGGAKAQYDGIVAFSQTDFTEDLKKVTVPSLVMHSDDDQVVPYADSGPLTTKLLSVGTLKTYSGFPHGMLTTQAETINTDLLAFVRQTGRSTIDTREDFMSEVVSRTAASAAEGRPSFVDRVLNDAVERTGGPIPDEVRDYILTDVLKPENAWHEGLAAGRFDPDQAAEILADAVDELIRELPSRGFERSMMEEVFYQVIHDRWHCPFPFVFC